jgi:hypothetical protein
MKRPNLFKRVATYAQEAATPFGISAKAGDMGTEIAAQQQTINSTLSKYNVLPVLQLGVGYRF